MFGADGGIIDAVLNVPGHVHDSQVAQRGGTCTGLEEVFDGTGGICSVDSAFAAANVPHLIKFSENSSNAKTALERGANERSNISWTSCGMGNESHTGAFP